MKKIKGPHCTYKDSSKWLHNLVMKGRALLTQMVSGESGLCCELTNQAFEAAFGI